MTWFGSGKYQGPVSVDRRLRLLSTGHARRQPLPTRRASHELKVVWDVTPLGPPEDPIGDLEDWLGDLYERCSRGASGTAIDLVISGLGGLLAQRQWERCNTILTRLELPRLLPAVLLAVLTETFSARAHLPRREQLYRDIEKHLLDKMSEKKVQRLLARLK